MPNAQPITVDRPANSHRYDAFSPKLDRGLTLFSRRHVDYWILLEVDPDVRSFCERPAELPSYGTSKKRLVDFSVERKGVVEYVLLVDAVPDAHEFIVPDGCQLRFVEFATLHERAIFIANWRSMLPYITTYRRWLKKADLKRTVAHSDRSMPLAELQALVSRTDPGNARALIFAAILKGLLRAPSLHLIQWDLSTVIERDDHAT